MFMCHVHVAPCPCRCPAPNEPPFVKAGDRVKKGQTVCIIEAMKLMNEIEVRGGVFTLGWGLTRGLWRCCSDQGPSSQGPSGNRHRLT
jgi:hypothetical protein